MASDAPKISLELVENVAKNNCVLFLGAELPSMISDWMGPPNPAQLTVALAKKYTWVNQSQPFGVAAEEFLSQDLSDYHALVSFVRETILQYTTPGPLHRTVAELGFAAIVSSTYDDLLEIAMQEANRRVLQVVGDNEIAYAGGKEDSIIIRLAGTVSRAESLILTNEDQIQVENRLSEKLQAVRSWLVLHPLLFIGWNPEDTSLRRLYQAATEKLGKHKRRNYIIWPNPSRSAIAIWQRYNVEIVPSDPLIFLRLLQIEVQQHLHQNASEYQPDRVVGKTPYKFLNYFDPEDRDIFCGREIESQIAYRLALSYPLLALFGQSGVGKTSLLRAGVVPRLLEAGYRYVYIRLLGNPLDAIRQQLAQELNISLPTREGQTLLAFLREVLDPEKKLVIILDQFEELFTRPVSSRAHRQFWREMSACLGMMNPEIRFILSLREDYLAYLDEARHPLSDGEAAPVPFILHNSYRLKGLEVSAAYLAIVQPAQRANTSVEPVLVDVLMGRAGMPDLSKEEEDTSPSHGSGWSLVESDGMVPPPSLQIVMDYLYRSTLASMGFEAPPRERIQKTWQPPPLTLTLEHYRSLGGARHILADYVKEALDTVSVYGGEQELAVALLKVMVTSQSTKAALETTDLIQLIVETLPNFDSHNDTAALYATRDALIELRLIRSFTIGERTLYELAHDHIATEVATWIGKEEMQAKLARELLRRDIENWRQQHLLIGLEALQLINTYRYYLLHLTAEEAELIFRSALASNYEVLYWSRRAYEVGVARDEIIQENLKSPNFSIRVAITALLGKLTDEAFIPQLITMLSDPYPQVRASTILALEGYRTPQAHKALLENLKYEVYVSAGTFIMGSDEEGAGDEGPAHMVSLDAFYLSKYPITNGEYKLYMDNIGRTFEIPAGKIDHPVVKVSWYDAKDYAMWAAMRLPTEAEWEKAASWDEAKGSKRKYPWGNEFDKQKCNTAEAGIGETTPVSFYSPQGDSPYHCGDMAGNVSEWVSSYMREYPYQADADREGLVVETLNQSIYLKARRGGSFNTYSSAARTMSRMMADPFTYNWYIGFRVALSSSPMEERP